MTNDFSGAASKKDVRQTPATRGGHDDQIRVLASSHLTYRIVGNTVHYNGILQQRFL